jgi:hypothetical protein
MAERLGIKHPRGQIRHERMLTRVSAILREHPEFIAKQVIANVGLEHPLGVEKAWRLLRACRMSAAKRSSMHRKIGWRIDSRTPTRIRISRIWKRNPDLTAKQIIEKLGLAPFTNIRWIQQVMQECRRGRPFRRRIDRF